MLIFCFGGRRGRRRKRRKRRRRRRRREGDGKRWEGNPAVTLLQVTQYAGGLLICFVYTQQWSYGCIDATSLIIASCTEKAVQDWFMSCRANLKKDQ